VWLGAVGLTIWPGLGLAGTVREPGQAAPSGSESEAAGLAEELPSAGEPGSYSTLQWPVGQFLDYSVDTGILDNPARDNSVVYDAVISVEGSNWLRLYFGKVELEPGSFIRVTSALDGEVQELDAAGLSMWSNTTAYFNGDTVYLEVIAGPQTTRNQVVLERVAVEFGVERGPCAPDDCGICGTDNRVQSSELWTGRLMPVGCTASVYNTQSCLVSAGHCVSGGQATVIQFNVPNSSSNCATVNPPVADQFPIVARQYYDGGIGNDWAVMRTGTNSLGQRPYDRYGAYRPMASSFAPVGAAVAVWGYGVDNNNPTWSQTQQTASGTVGARLGSYYEHNVDVTYGNSGSALIRTSSSEIIGIVTHCSFSCENIATRHDLSNFTNARESLCPTSYCSASSSSTSYEYISRVEVGTIDNPSSSSGYADYTGLSTDMQIGTGYTITVTLSNASSATRGGLWVDWNRDLDFADTGEAITTSWSGGGPYTVVITPPTGAVPGQTRLRVRIQNVNYDPTVQPCGTTSRGEVEDYGVNIVPAPDNTPPSPDPMTWSVPPYAVGTNAISMTATLAVDEQSPPVQYEFEFVSGGSGGTSSGWQLSRDYMDTGLEPNTTYSYRVRARDSASTPNVTGYSTVATAATLANVPAAPTLSSPGPTSMRIDVNPNGNPAYTQFAIMCTGTNPYDLNWLNTWVNASGRPADNPVWRTDAEWGNMLLTGLRPNTTYTFAVKARNLDNIETLLGPGASLATTPAYQPGDMNCDGSINAFDIDGFVLALSNPTEYQQQYPNCNYMLGDINGDGAVNAFDIDPFVDLLTGK